MVYMVILIAFLIVSWSTVKQRANRTIGYTVVGSGILMMIKHQPTAVRRDKNQPPFILFFFKS